MVSLEKVSGIELVSKKNQNTVSETIFNFACVAGAERGRGGGGGKNPLTPLPLHFPLPFNPLPLSTSATQALFNYDHRKKSSDLNDRRDYMKTSLYNRIHLKDMFYMYLSFGLARNVSRTLIKRIRMVQIETKAISFSSGAENIICLLSYRKIPKISPRAYIFQRPFLRGLYLEGRFNGGFFALRVWGGGANIWRR